MPTPRDKASAEVPDVTYTLSTLVMPMHENQLEVMHGGWMMSWMDMAAWVVAARAVVPDQTVFFKAATDVVWTGPIHAGEVCTIEARLAKVGRTSLTIDLVATAEDPSAKTTRPVCSSTFTMVAGRDGEAETVRLHAPPPPGRRARKSTG
jgi:acyl-CoA thioesterase YciA